MYLFSVVADLHLDDWPRWAHKTDEGSNTRLEAQIKVVKDMLSLSQHTPKRLVIAGDTANPRKESLPLAVSNGITNLMNWCSANMESTYVIEGNHDYPWRTPDKGKLSSVSICKRDNVHVVEGCKIVKIPLIMPGSFLDLCLLSYQPTEEALAAAINYFFTNTGPDRVLIAHQPLMEGMLDNGGLAIKGNSPDTFQPEKWKLILLGDYHRPQKIRSNMFYVGAPYELNRGDARHDGPRGYVEVHFDPITNTVQHKYIASQHTNMKFVTIDVTDDTDVTKNIALHKEDFVTFSVLPAAASRFAQIEAIARANYTFPPEVLNQGRLKASDLTDDARYDGITANTDPIDVVKAYIARRGWEPLNLEYLFQTCKYCLDRIPVTNAGIYRGFIVFKQLDMINFMSHRNTSVKLDNIGLVLLDGKNGAGKSSIFEGIYVTLFGKTMRELPVKKVRNRFVDEDCVLKLTLSTEHSEIRIERTFPFKGSEQVRIYRNGVEEPVFKDSAQKIYEITGISETYFKAAGILSANILSRFMAASTSERQRIIQEMIDTEPYDLAFKVASEQLNSIDANIRDLSSLSDRALGAKEQAERAIAQLTAERDIFELRTKQAKAELGGRIASVQEKVNALQDQLNLKNAAIAAMVIPTMNVPAEALQYEAQAAMLQSEINTRHHQLGGYSADLARAQALKEKMRQYESGKSKCPTCLQSIGLEHINSCIAAADVDGRDAAEMKTKLNDEIFAFNLQIKELTDKARQLRAQNDLNYQRANQDYQSVYNEARTVSVALQVAQAEIAALRNEQDKVQSQSTNYDVSIERERKRVEENTAIYQQRKTELESISGSRPLMAAAHNIFSSTGVKNFLLDTITPAICLEAMRCLELVAPGQYSITSAVKSTAVQDKLTFAVDNKRGSDDPRGNSDGEKNIVDLCTLWAINRVAVRWNILDFDEPFSAFDDTVTPRAFRLLESAANEGRSIICTTHRDDLKNLFPQRWLVEKTEVNGIETSILHVG